MRKLNQVNFYYKKKPIFDNIYYKNLKMKKIIYLNESDLYQISNRVIEEQELDEIMRFNLPVGTQLGNIYQGIRGFTKGESYSYFNYLSKIKNRSKRVMNEIDHIETFVKYLIDLRPKIEKIKIAPEKKLRLLNLLDRVINKWQPFFPEFSDAIKEVNKLSSEKLSGKRLDVVPGLDPNEIGSDLMEPQVAQVNLGGNNNSSGSKSTGGNPNPMGGSKSTGGNSNPTGGGSKSTGGNSNPTGGGSKSTGNNPNPTGGGSNPTGNNPMGGSKNTNPIVDDDDFIDYEEVDDTDEPFMLNPPTEKKPTTDDLSSVSNRRRKDPNTKDNWGSGNKPKNDIGIDDDDLSDEEKMLLGKTVTEEIERFKELIR